MPQQQINLSYNQITGIFIAFQCVCNWNCHAFNAAETIWRQVLYSTNNTNNTDANIPGVECVIYTKGIDNVQTWHITMRPPTPEQRLSTATILLVLKTHASIEGQQWNVNVLSHNALHSWYKGLNLSSGGANGYWRPLSNSGNEKLRVIRPLVEVYQDHHWMVL